MPTLLITPPATLAVSLADVKAHLRIDGTDEDATLTHYIEAATAAAQTYSRRSLITATWRKVLDCFPVDRIPLDFPPLLTVSSIIYTDTNGTSQTLSSSAYRVITEAFKGWVEPAYGTSWPNARDLSASVKVTYTAGFGSSASDLPDQATQAIKLAAGHFFEYRDVDATLPKAFFLLLDQIKVCEVV